jgi:hypothetical protein|tara:strand:+ start:2032 stop:2232 length:201 start_codon:yes stop_codon:yes gene_type:complete
MYWSLETKEDKRKHILKMDLKDCDKKIVEFDKIAETTLDIIYSMYSGDKMKEKKRYKPKYLDHKKY